MRNRRPASECASRRDSSSFTERDFNGFHRRVRRQGLLRRIEHLVEEIPVDFEGRDLEQRFLADGDSLGKS